MGTPLFKPAGTIVSQIGAELRLGEKAARRLIERGPRAQMEARARTFPKGQWGTGTYAGFRVLQTTVTVEQGGIAQLIVDWEVDPIFGGGDLIQLPQSDWSITPFEINPPVSTHPNFSALTADDFKLVREATEGSDEAARDQAYNQLSLAGAPDAALDLIALIDAKIETYYLAGLVFRSWTYHFTMPALSKGGTVETPSGVGAEFLPADYAWLRECDVPERENAYYKVTRTWRGAPQGHWRAELYEA